MNAQICEDLGPNCSWEYGQCRSNGPCVSEDAYKCFASLNFMREIPNFPESYEACASLADCEVCANDVISGGMCHGVLFNPSAVEEIPESCGLEPNVCLEFVTKKCEDVLGQTAMAEENLDTIGKKRSHSHVCFLELLSRGIFRK